MAVSGSVKASRTQTGARSVVASLMVPSYSWLASATGALMIGMAQVLRKAGHAGGSKGHRFESDGAYRTVEFGPRRAPTRQGACIAGGAVGSGSSGFHHWLRHALGGAFGATHDETHAVLLVHSVDCSGCAVPDGSRRVTYTQGVSDAAIGIHTLAKQIAVPTSLDRSGVAESDLDKAGESAAARGFPNPQRVTAERIRALLQNAFHGLPPQPV